jgi:hypothetical protein
MKLICILAIVFLSVSAQGQTYLQINGASIHDQSGFNGFNYGGGLEQTVSDNWNLAAGWYRNSEWHGSTYAYGRYSFYQSEKWNLGIATGAVTGYNVMRVLPMAFPEACYNYVCAIVLPKVEPSGANVLGLHLKIPLH